MKLTETMNKLVKGLPRKETLIKIIELNKKQEAFDDQTIEKMCEQKNALYVDSLQTLSAANLLPHILEFIQEAKKEGYLLAIASSSKNAPMILNKLNIAQYFDYIVNPQSVINGKPAPDIYLAAASGLDLNPNECVGIEDAEVGIKGLNQAGIFTVGIDNGNEKIKNQANISFSTTNELDLKQIVNVFNNRK